jgi:hypothetical protein
MVEQSSMKKRIRKSKSIRYTKRMYCFKNDTVITNKIKEGHTNGKFDVLEAKYAYIIHKGVIAMTHSKPSYEKDGFPLRKQANQDLVKEKPELHFGTLKHLFGGPNGVTTKIVNNLISWGVIRVYQEPVPKRSSTKYKFTEQWENQAISMRYFTGIKNSLIWKLNELDVLRLQHPIARQTQVIYDEHVRLSDEGLKFIAGKYNHPVVDDILDAYRGEYLKDNMAELTRGLHQVDFQNEDIVLLNNFLLPGAKCNDVRKGKRFYHSITNLKREYRKFVLIDNKPIIEVDLVNSQPTFSVGFIKGVYFNATRLGNQDTQLPSDFLLYEELCCNGQFYEAIAEKAGIVLTEENRSDFKEDFFKNIFYSRINVKDNPIKRAFKELFPNVYQTIKGIKSLGYKKFATWMQDFEADLMVFAVYKQLLDENFKVLVLHDAILCNSLETAKRAKDLIREQFKCRYNQRIRFKDEKLEDVPLLKHTNDVSRWDDIEAMIEKLESVTDEEIDEDEDMKVQ